MTASNEDSASSSSQWPLKNAYALSKEAAEKALGSSWEAGLSRKEAQKRRNQWGPNRLQTQSGRAWYWVMAHQFKSPIVWVLVVAMGFSLYMGEYADTYAIAGILLLNTLIGFFMEWQAERSMAALRQMDRSYAKVFRERQTQEIDAEKLTYGDLLFLEAGDMVPADARLAEVNDLEADESALTGESLPRPKSEAVLPQETTLAERDNMVYKGTALTKGNAWALVAAIGQQTEMGQISELVATAEKAAPSLEKKLEKLTTIIIIGAASATGLFFLTGLLKGMEMTILIQTTVVLAVASIPEGLPIVATIALASGVRTMARKNVIVKRLEAVETLGETDTILTDKTGTLTQNRIRARGLFHPQWGRLPIGGHQQDNAAQASVPEDFLAKLRLVAALCNNAQIETEKGEAQELGDPLEVALLRWVQAGMPAHGLEETWPRVKELPFSSDTMMMATLHQNPEGGYWLAAKGALEPMLAASARVYSPKGPQTLQEHQRNQFREQAETFSKQGLRVLALAYRASERPPEALDQHLVLLGLIAFEDPPRMEVLPSVERCHRAGIEVAMLTGDHPETALSIAKQVGMVGPEETRVVSSQQIPQLEQATPTQEDQVLAPRVYARVSPAQKLDLVNLYQDRGRIVAMTGDGVNDAPALKKADVGVAMGKRGTQVAAETADLVLQDDSFPSIVAAIEQGRIIFGNIRKFLLFLLSANISELIIVGSTGFIGKEPLLTPLQILFLNIFTDVFPALALGIGKGTEQVMERPPSSANEPLLPRPYWYALLSYSVVISGVVLLSYAAGHFWLDLPHREANNVVFLSLAGAQLLHVFNVTTERVSFWRNDITRNPYIWGALALCFGLVALAVIIPPMRHLLEVVPLPQNAWALIALASVLPLPLIQALKRSGLIR